MSNKTVKVAIIVDFMGGGGRTDEEEIEDHKARFSELLAPALLNAHRAFHPGEGEHGIEEGTELVIYDFGGLGPGSSLMESNAEAIIEWAEEHPSGLVVVVSSFTYRNFIEIEMQQRRLTLPNIVCDDSWGEKSPIPDWFMAGLK